MQILSGGIDVFPFPPVLTNTKMNITRPNFDDTFRPNQTVENANSLTAYSGGDQAKTPFSYLPERNGLSLDRGPKELDSPFDSLSVPSPIWLEKQYLYTVSSCIIATANISI